MAGEIWVVFAESTKLIDKVLLYIRKQSVHVFLCWFSGLQLYTWDASNIHEQVLSLKMSI
jgi:hypothetical protein